MFLKAVRAIARPQTFAVLDLLKRSSGLSVNEIAKALKISYMGIKQYCSELEKKGLVDTWRRPTMLGRPEIAYRLTAKAAHFYPEVGNEMTLDLLKSIAQIYGETAPEKLLFNYFQKKAEAYLKHLKGSSLTERAVSLAKLRDTDGCCAQVEYDETLGFRVVEFHSPWKEIATHFPCVLRMEELMFSKVLGLNVTRSEEILSGLMRISFQIPLSIIPQDFSKVKVATAVAKTVKAPRSKKQATTSDTPTDPATVIPMEMPATVEEAPKAAPVVQEELFLLVG